MHTSALFNSWKKYGRIVQIFGAIWRYLVIRNVLWKQRSIKYISNCNPKKYYDLTHSYTFKNIILLLQKLEFNNKKRKIFGSLRESEPVRASSDWLLRWKMMPSSKFYCHPSEKGDAKKSSSHFSGLTLQNRTRESWGKQPNSLNTRSKKAINLEAKWKIGPSE